MGTTLNPYLGFRGNAREAMEFYQQVFGGDTVSISIGGEEAEELQAYWDRLSEGATVLVPLGKAAWGDSFGMLKDRFGFTWRVNIAGSAVDAANADASASA